LLVQNIWSHRLEEIYKHQPLYPVAWPRDIPRGCKFTAVKSHESRDHKHFMPLSHRTIRKPVINPHRKYTLRIEDKSADYNRKPQVDPSHSLDMVLSSVSCGPVLEKLLSLTPKYRIKQIHRRHIHRLFYSLSIGETYRHHLLCIFQSTQVSAKIKHEGGKEDLRRHHPILHRGHRNCCILLFELSLILLLHHLCFRSGHSFSFDHPAMIVNILQCHQSS